MDRVVRTSPVYLGLFLLMFGLYAAERSKAPVVSVPVVPVVVDETPESVEYHSALTNLFRRLKVLPLLKSPIDGVKISQNKNGILLTVQSEDLYRDGEVAMRDTWVPLFEEVFMKISSEVGHQIKVQIKGFANEGNTIESRSLPMSQKATPYLFAASRADWLLKELASRIHFQLNPDFSIASGGAVPKGKRIEVLISEKN